MLNEILDYLRIPRERCTSLYEIRLTVGRRAALCGGFGLERTGEPVTREILDRLFRILCSYSVYAKQDEIKNGFITIKGGHRAGLCGTAVTENGNIINIKDISSVVIRVACEQKGCADSLLKRIPDISRGVLLCGAPCSGKTTLLRDIARSLSQSKKTAVIDSRGELAAVYRGIPQCDVGNSDVLNSYSKRDGFDHAVRCLSPDLIICDEIGAKGDEAAIENALCSGVSVVASAHCTDKKDLLGKPGLRSLAGFFGYIVFLERVGQIREVLRSDGLFR